MIQFNFTTNGVSTNGIELDWLQLNFNTTNSGNYFDNQFDAETNFPGNISEPLSRSNSQPKGNPPPPDGRLACL